MQAAYVPAGRDAAVWPLAAGAAWAPLNTNTEDWLAGFEGAGSTFTARFTGAAATEIVHQWHNLHVPYMNMFSTSLHDTSVNCGTSFNILFKHQLCNNNST